MVTMLRSAGQKCVWGMHRGRYGEVRAVAIRGWRKVDGLMEEDDRQNGRQDRLHQEPQSVD